MLGLNKQSLLFPKIVYLHDGKIVRYRIPGGQAGSPEKKSPKKDVENVRLYRLDWSDIERIKTARLKEHYDKFHSTEYPWCDQVLYIPRSYTDAMNNLVFAIPDSYMKAINHMCLMASQEWEAKYPFDTIVREHCYKSVDGYINSAFYLLSDCIYDYGKEYYSRNFGQSTVFKHMGMLRFWREQTGLCVAFEKSGFQSKIREKDSWQPFAYPEIDAMHHDMQDYMDKLVAEHAMHHPVVIEKVAKGKGNLKLRR